MSDDTETQAIQDQPDATSAAPVASGSSSEPPAQDAPPQGAVASGGDPAPKRKGRPNGAKDRAPRTRRPAVQVRVEPLVQAENVDNQMKPPGAAQAACLPTEQPRVPTMPTTEEPPPPPPPSPRSMLRETARHMTTLRQMVDNERRVKVHEEFSSKLLTWPIGRF
jgi:hypothetical protein